MIYLKICKGTLDKYIEDKKEKKCKKLETNIFKISVYQRIN